MTSDSYLHGKLEINMRLSLEPFAQWLHALKRPDQSIKIILVGGTNGKGSTAHFLHQLFARHGYKVGLNTSPHLETHHERIVINGRIIAEKSLVSIFEQMARYQSELNLPPLTYFETMTLAALLHFAEENVDFAVFEVGLGGRLDATNALHRIATGIASISLDHTHILGTDVVSIAREKAAIFRTDTINCLALQADEAVTSFLGNYGQEKSIPIYIPAKDYGFKSEGRMFHFRNQHFGVTDIALGLHGEHQAINAALACDIFSRTIPPNQLRLDSVRHALQTTHIPGRYERWQNSSTHHRVLIDIAHNPQAVKSFIEMLKTEPHLPDALVIGMAQDKDWKQCLLLLSELDMPLYLCPIASPRSWNPQEAATENVRGIFNTLEKAMEFTLSSHDAAALGSFYLAGPLRSFLRRHSYLSM